MGCPCSSQKIPLILDLEFDYFIHMVVPKSQIIVVSSTNSLYPNSNPFDNVMEKIYAEKNE